MIERESLARARALYRQTGQLKKHLLREDIAYSWIRSQVFNVKEGSLSHAVEFTHEDLLKQLMGRLKLLEADINLPFSLYLVDVNGHVFGTFEHNSPFELSTFQESIVGTNGVALSLLKEEPIIVSGEEHYLRYFDDHLTVALPLYKKERLQGALAILATIDQRDEVASWIATTDIERELLQLDFSKQEESTGFLHSDLREAILKIKDTRTPIFLHRRRSMGLNNLFHYMIERMPHLVPPLYTLDFQRKNTREAHDELDALNGQKGTLILYHPELSLRSQQKKLLAIISSKPINNEASKPENSKGLSLIMVSHMSLEELGSKRLLMPELLERLVFAKVEVADKIYDERQNGKRVNSLLSHFDTERQERLRYVYETGLMAEAHRYDDPTILKLLDLMTSDYEGVTYTEAKTRLHDEVGKRKSLESVEKETIVAVLEEVDYQMTLAAEWLGIGRSTLYRKIKKYQIETP